MSSLEASELCEAGTPSYFPLCPWPFATNDWPAVDTCYMTEAAEGKGGGRNWDSGGEMGGLQTRGARIQGQRRDQPLKTVCLSQLHSQFLN